MKLAYYNEFDKYAAEWLRNLIAAGHIAPGDVDDRSIEDVRPSDLDGYAQCHFFAGVGVWSYALRLAGWPDDRPVWTGSCPCQPFSAAGEGAGFDDERHLWPAFHHLIRERRPTEILGEQVASKDADPWIDLVCTDMEAMGYSFGAVPFPSAGVGAPHIRDRLYWVAHAANKRQHGRGAGQASDGRNTARQQPERLCDAGGMANTSGSRIRGEKRGTHVGAQGGVQGQGLQRQRVWNDLGDDGDGRASQPAEPGPVNGFWGNADWLLCRDGRWRPVEPGTFPLAHGAPARVGRLRAYGNAINAEAARVFIEAVMECAP